MNLGKETELIEFKESTSEKHEGCESISAMINKHGFATIYFGVLDNGDIKGQIVSDSTLKDLADTIMRDIEPKIIPTIETINCDNKMVIKVTASGNQQPYSAYGKFLIRVGTQNRKMSRDELVRLVKDANYSSSWENLLSAYTVEDIKDESLLRYYNEAVGSDRLEMSSYDKESLLSTLGLTFNGRLKNAGYALFGKNPNIGLKIASYATDEKLTFTDLKLFKGNIYDLIDEAMVYIKNHINWKIDFGGTQRIETPEIPIRAIREMVVNAFAHTEYEGNPEIEISMHPGMITIFNPGSFPDNLTPFDFITKNISSIKRNPLILDTLFRCKDVEKSGTGFRRMNQLCNEAKIVWSYENTAYGFYFTFYRNNNSTQKEYTKSAAEHRLNTTELEIYNLIKNDTKILKPDIATSVNKSLRTIQRYLNDLMSNGYIKRVGNNQYGYWEILK